jgi:hypothetical protein
LPGEKVLQEFCMDLYDVFSWVYLTACINIERVKYYDDHIVIINIM